jgi:hypothetical protein
MVKNFLILQIVQTCSKTQSVSYPMGSVGTFSGGLSGKSVKLHSAKKCGSTQPLPPYVFMASCLISYAQEPIVQAIVRNVFQLFALNVQCSISVEFVHSCEDVTA